MKSNSLRGKFIVLVVAIIIPIATSSITSLVISKKINDHYNVMMNLLSTTNRIKGYLSDSFNNFNEYFLTNRIESKNLYAKNLAAAISSVEYLEPNSDIQSKYILRDLRNSLESYKASGDDTIKLFDKQGVTDAYYVSYVSTKDISSYCNTFIAKLISSYLNYNDEMYNRLKEKEKFTYKILIIYIITIILSCIIYALLFLRNISGKLRELVDTSEKVASGNFSYYEGKKTFIYELDILSEAFNTMITNIKKYINSIKENAELETKIRNDEVKILRYENALKMSQLKVLQSQINPHFLFNTLNCINQTAIKEDAADTEMLIRSVSGILRYSLSMMNRNATLQEEVNVVKQYMFIQKLRFEERIEFKLNINAELARIEVPGMTLQPFVENAFIHGIEPKEEGGTISIDIFKEDNRCVVLIEDTGCGIDEDTLKKIMSKDVKQEHIGHTTGMGIKSVVERLELMYEDYNIFKIESKKSFGTKIYLKIPIRGLNEQC